MLILISPAKSLDETPQKFTKRFTLPRYEAESKTLVRQLKKMKPHDIAQLMSVSDALAIKTAEQYKTWSPPFSTSNAKQAIFMFRGDVFLSLAPECFSAKSIAYSQKHLRILSGLHGVLSPLDLIQPYRLEMGTSLATKKWRGLYEFWGSKICDDLNETLGRLKSDLIVNLASNEYFKATRPKELHGEIVTPVFKDEKKGKFKVISFFAKKARGLMSRYLIENQVKTIEQMKDFDLDRYGFNEDESTRAKMVFYRSER